MTPQEEADDGLAMLETGALSEEEQHRLVDRVMRQLEAMADFDTPGAHARMQRLMPIAGRVFRHDICDAIALWQEAWSERRDAKRKNV